MYQLGLMRIAVSVIKMDMVPFNGVCTLYAWFNAAKLDEK